MDNINRLFDKYKNNQCSPEEVEQLLAYFKDADNADMLKAHIDEALTHQADDDTSLQEDADEVYANIHNQIFNKAEQHSRRLLMVRWLAAASVIVCVCAGGYFFAKKPQPTENIAIAKTNDLLPGSNKATLTIANGQQIDISGARQGKIATQGHTAINKTGDGQIIYDEGDANAGALVYNTMTTPRGGQYPLTLSDGTKVWLDAASSITFPVDFIGKERAVSITGQAYFEVAHNANKPFRVTANGQTVEVLGTHFNINAYADEPGIKTTLLQGSVRVSRGDKSALLVPGQQSISAVADANNLEIKNVDTDEAVAWHKGLFKFQDATIQAVMRQLSRWYDVEISYEGKVTDRRFSGEIYRDVKASKIAEILSYKNIHFRIEGKKIIVLP